MAHLQVDLNDPESMRTARRVIDRELDALGEADEAPSTSSDRDISPTEAERLARELWDRVGEPTRQLIQGFALASPPASLQEVAAVVGLDYDTIKARKFRFGRTEKTIKRDWGVDLVPGEWHEDERLVRYTMNDPVARALREKVIESE